MVKLHLTLGCAAIVLAGSLLHGRQPSTRQLAEERAQAEVDAPKLAEVLELKPGMTVADVGAGGGAMTVVLGKWHRARDCDRCRRAGARHDP